MIINVEAQKDYYQGYQIPTRGVFYCARMISSQMGTEFFNAEYDNIKKVYSIWICMNVPKKIGNAIAEYRMEKEISYRASRMSGALTISFRLS